MKARNMVISGAFSGCGYGYFTDHIVTSEGNLYINRDNVKGYQVLNAVNNGKTVGNMAGRAVVGAVIAGPVGALIGGATSQDQECYQVKIVWANGLSSVVEIDRKRYNHIVMNTSELVESYTPPVSHSSSRKGSRSLNPVTGDGDCTATLVKLSEDILDNIKVKEALVKHLNIDDSTATSLIVGSIPTPCIIAINFSYDKLAEVKKEIESYNSLLVITEPEIKKEEKKQININQNASPESLKQRAMLFIEDGDFESSRAYCDYLLDIIPTDATLYEIMLLNEYEIKSIDDLCGSISPIDNSKNYQRIVKFGNEEQISKIQSINSKILFNIENQEKISIYNKATEKASTGLKCDVIDAISLYKTIIDWDDSADKIRELENKLENFDESAKTYVRDFFNEFRDENPSIYNKYESSLVDFRLNNDERSTIECFNSFISKVSNWQKSFVDYENNIKEFEEENNKYNSLLQKYNADCAEYEIQEQAYLKNEELKVEIYNKETELSKLGIFSGKKKAQLSSEIDELKTKINNSLSMPPRPTKPVNKNSSSPVKPLVEFNYDLTGIYLEKYRKIVSDLESRVFTNSYITLVLNENGTISGTKVIDDKYGLFGKGFDQAIGWKNVKQFGVYGNYDDSRILALKENGAISVTNNKDNTTTPQWNRIRSLTNINKVFDSHSPLPNDLFCAITENGDLVCETLEKDAEKAKERGLLDTSHLHDIESFYFFTCLKRMVVRKKDGTIDSTNYTGKDVDNTNYELYKDLYNVSDIISNDDVTFGVREDGTIQMVRYSDDFKEFASVLSTSNVEFYSRYTKNTSIVLLKNGTILVKAGDEKGIKIKEIVSSWKNIIKIYFLSGQLLGLDINGNINKCVFEPESKYYDEYDLSEWNDIICLRAAAGCILGVRKDGTLIGTGDNEHGALNIKNLKIFDNYNDYVNKLV